MKPATLKTAALQLIHDNKRKECTIKKLTKRDIKYITGLCFDQIANYVITHKYIGIECFMCFLEYNNSNICIICDVKNDLFTTINVNAKKNLYRGSIFNVIMIDKTIVIEDCVMVNGVSCLCETYQNRLQLANIIIKHNIDVSAVGNDVFKNKIYTIQDYSILCKSIINNSEMSISSCIGFIWMNNNNNIHIPFGFELVRTRIKFRLVDEMYVMSNEIRYIHLLCNNIQYNNYQDYTYKLLIDKGDEEVCVTSINTSVKVDIGCIYDCVYTSNKWKLVSRNVLTDVSTNYWQFLKDLKKINNELTHDELKLYIS